MAEPVALIAGEGVSLADIERVLVGELGCHRAGRGPLRRTYYDTFDGRLHRAGLVLEHEELDGRRWLRVRALGKTAALAQAAVDTVPGAVAALADRRLRALLAAPCGDRALLGTVSIEGELERYGCLDDLDKTTVRVSVVTGSSSARGRPSRRHQLEPVITVSPVRGHERAHERFVRAVSERLGSRSAADPLRRAAGAAAVTVGVDPSDRRVELEAAEPAAAAIGRLLQRAAAVLEANVGGVRARTDDEFLHDFRITLRATRALVAASRPVLDPGHAERLREGLRELMVRTSVARDLDVLRAAWRGDDVLGGLIPVLDAERDEAQRTVCDALDGDLFVGVLAELRGPHPVRTDVPVPEDAAHWAADALAGQLRRLHRRAAVVAEVWGPPQHAGGPAVGDGSRKRDDAVVHRARKAAKALRYLLDATAPLDPQDTLRPLRKVLRELQTDLGAFQDAAVAVAAVERVGRRLVDPSPEVLLELGRRSEQLHLAGEAAVERFVARQDELWARRRRIEGRIAGLAAPPVRHAVRPSRRGAGR